MKQGGLVSRYAFTTLVFTVSGVFHALSDISQGIPLGESGATRFFCIQALGIMVEDAAQALFKQYRGGEMTNKTRTATRAAGYLWVVAWLSWTSPIWIYPAMARDKGTPLVPF